MRDFSPTELAYLQKRDGYMIRLLLWVQPRDRATNARVALGFWTGEQDQTFTINGDDRAYSAGSLVSVDPIVMQTGLVVRMQRVTLSPLSPEVALFLRGYDAWRAPVEIHRAFFDTDTQELIAEPHRVWKGVVDAAPIQTPAIGGEANVELTLSSAVESLTHGLSATRSDAVQSQRGGDRFYRYKDVAGTVSVSWGETRAAAPTTFKAFLKKTGTQVFDGDKR